MRKNDPVCVKTARSFWMQARARLTHTEYQSAILSLEKLQRSPGSKGRNLKELAPNLFTIRVNSDIRILLLRREQSFTAIDVDHHDSLLSRLNRRGGGPGIHETAFELETSSETPGDTQPVQARIKIPPLAGVSDDDLRAHGASPEIIHKLRQATTIDRVLEVVDAEAPHLEHIILDTLSATEGSVLEIAAKAREADVLRKQVRSLQDQQQHDQLRAADLTQQLDGERSRGVTLDTELQQLRQQAPSPKADARIFQLAHEVEVNRRNLDTLEQRLRDLGADEHGSGLDLHLDP